MQATVFGPGRFARTAFRLREGAAPLDACSFVALSRGDLVGAVTLSAIAVGATQGALLGPLAVLPEAREKGIGRALLAKATERAFVGGLPFVLLVGDAPYYAPYGFQTVPFGNITMPGPVDPARLLIALNPSLRAGVPSGAARAVSQQNLERSRD